MTFNGPCTTSQIPPHHAAVLDAITRGEALSFDLANVRTADVSLVQLLVAAKSAGERHNLPFKITAASEAVTAAFAAAGIPWTIMSPAIREA